MTIVTWAKAKIRDRVRRVLRTQLRAVLEPVLPQLLEYYFCDEDERLSHHEFFQDATLSHLRSRLVDAGVAVEDAELDLDDFHRWMAELPELTRDWGGRWRIEKCLEHYLTFRQLRFSPNDCYVDVGAARSRFAHILRKKRVRAYRLDIIYARGRRGMNIGAEAAATGLPDGYVNALSVQDAFSFFVGDTDIRFFQEVARLLKAHGRYTVVPLFLSERFVNIVDPWSNARSIPLDAGAKRVWRDNRADIRFARHYSPESFHERIWTKMPESLVSRVVYFKNLPELQERYPEQHIYAFFMLCGEKQAGPVVTPARVSPAAAAWDVRGKANSLLERLRR